MANKGKGKKKAGGGVEAAERKRQRLEARRREKAEALAAARRRQMRQRVLRVLTYAGVLVLLAWFFFFRVQTPDEINGHAINKFSESGVNEHVSGPVTYDTIPPVSGPHAGQAAACGIYAQPVPNENLVHSLEHGAVAVLYQPELEIETIRRIEDIVSSFESRTIAAPYPGMESPIVVASWGEKMPLQSLDAAAVREYIEEFRGKGPEGIDCPNTRSERFEPVPAATPSPSPTDDQEGGDTGGGKGGGEDGGKGGRKNKGGGSNDG